MPELLPAALIYHHPDARAIDEKRVVALADSIRVAGLLSPIIVRKAMKYRNGSKVDAYEIVAGHHRYEACARLLRMEMIPCDLRVDDELILQLITIDENLMRVELTDAQRASAVAERKRIYEALHPETAAGAAQAAGMNRAQGRGRQIGDDVPDRFTKHTADATGMSERAVQRMAERGERLKDVLPDVVGTSLDKASELDAMKSMPKAEVVDLVARAKAGERVSARKASPSAAEREDPEFLKIKTAFLLARPEARTMFDQWRAKWDSDQRNARRAALAEGE